MQYDRQIRIHSKAITVTIRELSTYNGVWTIDPTLLFRHNKTERTIENNDVRTTVCWLRTREVHMFTCRSLEVTGSYFVSKQLDQKKRLL